MPTLDFKGKQFIYGYHLTVPIRTLKIDQEEIAEYRCISSQISVGG